MVFVKYIIVIMVFLASMVFVCTCHGIENFFCNVIISADFIFKFVLQFLLKSLFSKFLCWDGILFLVWDSFILVTVFFGSITKPCLWSYVRLTIYLKKKLFVGTSDLSVLIQVSNICFYFHVWLICIHLNSSYGYSYTLKGPSWKWVM